MNECPMEALSSKDKKDIMMRIAKRHQADVGSICVLDMQVCDKLVYIYHVMITQANTAQQLGFQMASMYYIDKEIITVGTK